MLLAKTAKQSEAIDLIGKNSTVLLEGGSRSGKTVILIYAMIVRALKYPNTWHLATRLKLTHAIPSLWHKTIPDVLRWMGLSNAVKENNSEHYIEFPHENGNSKLWVAGLDDKDRVEKILGNEFATVYLNEASQIPYETYEILTTRLSAPKNVSAKMLIDYNPPSSAHWGYKIFHNRQFPDGRKVPDNDYAWLKINPKDNEQNLSGEFFERLKKLSINKRKRFLDGEYLSDEGALWQRRWIKYQTPPKELVRVVVGVDPSGSVDGDEIGIVLAGLDEDCKKYVLADLSMHGTPNEWGAEVCRGYQQHLADVVAAEKNYGGDMVEAVITQFGRTNINVKLVNASRGKRVRAEPISAMYERGEIFHAGQFLELEDELCTTNFNEVDKSPNRLDALVWALTELSEESDLSYVG